MFKFMQVHASLCTFKFMSGLTVTGLSRPTSMDPNGRFTNLITTPKIYKGKKGPTKVIQSSLPEASTPTCSVKCRLLNPIHCPRAMSTYPLAHHHPTPGTISALPPRPHTYNPFHGSRATTIVDTKKQLEAANIPRFDMLS